MSNEAIPYKTCKETCSKSSCNSYTPSYSGDSNSGGGGDNAGDSGAVTFLSIFALLPIYFVL